MNYISFRKALSSFEGFTPGDIRKIDPSFQSRRLHEWQQKGYIVKLRRGHYRFADTPLTEEKLFHLANHLYDPSYISLESALAYYGLIPEGVYTITSVTTRKTGRFTSPTGTFTYQHIKENIFFGYGLRKYGTLIYKFTEREKAVLDYLYLHPELSDEGALQEWRFDGEEFLRSYDGERFERYLKAYDNKELTKRARNLIAYIHNNA